MILEVSQRKFLEDWKVDWKMNYQNIEGIEREELVIHFKTKVHNSYYQKKKKKKFKVEQ